jgi:hypothetical protein
VVLLGWGKGGGLEMITTCKVPTISNGGVIQYVQT